MTARRASVLAAAGRNELVVAGAVMLGIVVLIALLAPVLPFGDPFTINPLARNAPMSWQHPFGADKLGRDLFARFAYGARLSLSICTLVALACLIVGTALGLLAGYYRGWVDIIISRIADTLMAFPSILLALGIVAAFGASMTNVIVTLSVVYMPRVLRVARAPALAESRRDYVEAARACGASDLRILVRHVLPNILAPVMVQATVVFAYAMVAEATLGFLGVGVPPPAPSWGNLLSEARATLMTAPSQTIFPAIGLAFAVLGVNLLGDGLRDLLDPLMRRQGDAA
ncbi:ABC transporter permease [Xanthobacter tagetidis]|jgi:peptide/nickel transport system permease protein|uniref:ABC transporter permease n=1 Tax=Xanthobacter tagetidis TaxID=60216 RepID=A0A3L7AJ51_9HYPH|nr:ABC transporter permease [Xanthobacter tagetidis]MBB6309080.1 peptide/nickel transport system permease protein [Xanthobacter tagetidis]RLP80429.1 ABC transporter permease [Xanthobacter tagetidis]